MDRHTHEVGALVGNLRLWHDQDGYEWEFIERMMREFSRHPEWYRGKTTPWKVFVSKRPRLAELVVARQQKDPGSRENAGIVWWAV